MFQQVNEGDDTLRISRATANFMHNSAIGGSALTGSAIANSNVGASMVSGDFPHNEERLNVRVVSFRNSNIEND